MIQSHQPTIFNQKVFAAVSSKADGNMSFVRGDAASVLAHRKAWTQQLGIGLNQVALMKVIDPEKWDVIQRVGSADAGRGATNEGDVIMADALVTDVPGVALGLLTADCIPIIMHDPRKKVLALAHCGWQSTNVNLAGGVIDYLHRHFATDPAEVRVYFGPAIQKDSYVLEGDIAQAQDPYWQPHLQHTTRGIAIDNVGFNVALLQQAGVRPEHIEVCPIDTATSPDYFSHYRAVRHADPQVEGRFTTIAMLKN